MMRYLARLAAVAVLLFTTAAPATGQDEPAAGDTGAAEGDFQETDGACGFPNFTDGSYTGTFGEDERGFYIEFTQGSTGDSGRFRSDADGNITFETEGDESYTEIVVEGDRLFAVYRYLSAGCLQEWVATVLMPPGFLETLLARNTPEPEPEPEPDLESGGDPGAVDTDTGDTGTGETDASGDTDSGSASGDSTGNESDGDESDGDESDGDDADQSGDEPDEVEIDDGGGIDWASLGLLILLLLFLFALATLLWQWQQSRLYRADATDSDQFVQRKPPENDTDTGPPGVIVDDGEAVPAAPPPPEGDCVPERQEFAAAQAAKDAAYAAGERADAELREAKAAYLTLQAATTNPLGPTAPELEVDEGASEQQREQAARIHAASVREWEAFEAEAAEAAGKLDAAKEAWDRAKADRDEAWEDFQRMRRRLEAARVALNNCDGSAGPADDEDEPPAEPDTSDPGGGSGGGAALEGGGTQTGGGEPGGGRPAVIDEPPEPAPIPEEEDEQGCTDGATKDGEVTTKTFEIVGGPITVNIGTAAWKRAGNTFDVEGFKGLDSDTVEDRSEDIERGKRKRISVKIPVTVVTVTCTRVLECEDDEWVDNGETRREESRAPGETIELLPIGADGNRSLTKDKRHASRMVKEAQGVVKELTKNEGALGEYECE